MCTPEFRLLIRAVWRFVVDFLVLKNGSFWFGFFLYGNLLNRLLLTEVYIIFSGNLLKNLKNRLIRNNVAVLKNTMYVYEILLLRKHILVPLVSYQMFSTVLDCLKSIFSFEIKKKILCYIIFSWSVCLCRK